MFPWLSRCHLVPSLTAALTTRKVEDQTPAQKDWASKARPSVIDKDQSIIDLAAGAQGIFHAHVARIPAPSDWADARGVTERDARCSTLLGSSSTLHR